MGYRTSHIHDFFGDHIDNVSAISQAVSQAFQKGRQIEELHRSKGHAPPRKFV